jgi:hypothetical protein
MLTTATNRGARPRASIAPALAGGSLHLRDAVTCLSGADRRHVILVYGPEGDLICWCGPYTPEERLAQATIWGGGGWRWTRSPPLGIGVGPVMQLGDMTVMIS